MSSTVSLQNKSTPSVPFKKVTTLAATATAVAGLFFSTFAASWIAGQLGISAAAASQVVNAIDKGGWALAAVGALVGGGISGAIIATTRAIIVKKGKTVAAA
ncbi:uberolysin/carnocyclin family circular bacteriocin [Corynebacterium variabile]|mgnify:CR=1 FL=1|uniref:Bacteriocin class IId cyclical uberolysin-like n=2 Tax=Corynebacterium variabile TaxID=1727 RepID=A0A0X8XVH9_9CORY|nr:uberolysin/carnocyclin family circular bacteriocin [Corynebacterium variabile]AEK36793.1 putative secreted protein [Corynebacterium variabile DSM 44702]CUU67557.1 Bacteriocin class IId cyclical uberolysin-like [Corynebacterium variabile]